MNDTCHHEAILTSFSTRRNARRAQAIRDAYIDDHSDQLLAQMLDESADGAFAKVVIAAHLGDFTGTEGDNALRRAIRVTGPGSRDLRCAALLALAKRIGTRATPDLLAGLAATDGGVKHYAVVGLAGTGGDDSAWKQVFGYLRSVLRRKRQVRGQSEVAYAVAYLAQHVADPSRRSEFVGFIRGYWTALDEADWFEQLWPDASPDGPDLNAVPSPDPAAIKAWARGPLFRPIGVPTA